MYPNLDSFISVKPRLDGVKFGLPCTYKHYASTPGWLSVNQNIGESGVLKDQYGPRVFFLEFPFFAENMIIRSILNLWWHSEILKLILGVVRGMFTKRLKGTRRLLYTVKSDFFEMTALHSEC